MIWPSAVLTHLAARQPILVRWMIWAVVKPFDGSPAVGAGLWEGDQDETLTVEGEARLYFGGQGGLTFDPVRYRIGAEVAKYRVGLSLSPEGEALLRGYDTRMAPAQVHCAVYNPDTLALVGIGRAFKGEIDASGIRTAEQGGTSSAEVTLVSTARRGTMTVAGHKSDASQRLRDPADAFRKDADLGAAASDPWAGE